MARTYRHFNFAGPGILLTLLMVISNTAFAQNEVSYRRGATQLEDILPPSPEAASKVKYADVPFTHSMGAAEYSVPIYELKGHRLTIPVSLDYCSNGIKLDEIAGVAGLGWTLNAGGCITREVVYMPDEFEDGTFSYRWPDSSVLQSLLARTTDNASASFLTGVAWNRMDTNSDRYSYSVMGLKGQFILDPDGKVVQIQGDGVEISYSTETVGGREEKAFTVTGPDGTVYTFGCREAATRKDQYREPTYSTGQQVDWSATTAWHLTQVTSRDGTESASFSYADGGTWDRSTATVSKTVTETPSRNTSGHDESYGSEYTTVRSSHQTKVLTGITLSGYTASFSYDSVASRSLHSVTSGSDAANYPRRLTRVRVTDAAGRQLLRAETDTRRDSYDGRIVLAGVTFYGSDDVTVEDRWTFAYHTAKGAVSRYSQDWYGYFNGENGDGTMLHPIDEDASRTDLCPYLLNSSPNYTMSLAYGAPKPAEASYMMLTSADHDGARTEWEYGGALTGAQITVAGKTVPVSVGVRVESIRVLDGAALKRVRTFSYGSPTTSAPALPLKEVYLRTSARLVLDNLTLPSARTAWTFTLSETPVTDGQALTSARVWYGSVTEDVSADGNSVGNRTVYTYDTAPVYNPVYDAGARFPSTWRETYSEGRLGIAPLSGVEQEYTYDGASTAPRLVRRETYRRNPSTGTAELVEKEETSYTSFPSASQLTGYRAVRVMQRLEEGPVYDQDFQHYPVYSQRSMGSAPSSVTRIGYHHSGNDTTVVSYGVVRNSYDKPARRTSVTVSSSDAVRSVTLTYPDTWPGVAPWWASSLASAHALSEPVKRTYGIVFPDDDAPVIRPLRTLPIGEIVQPFPSPDSARSRSTVTEYGTFDGRLMPARTVEYVDGAESWREEILSRDVLGNPTSVKEKGRPVTSVVWSYGGLYPVAVVEGASWQSVAAALGGQDEADAIARASTPSAAQLAALDGLRTAPQTSSAHVTTLTHAPGVGVLSETDPAGIRTSYSYDNGGRLASATNTLGETTDEYAYRLLNGGDNLLNATHYTYTGAGKSASYRDVTWWNTLGLKLEDVAVAASGTDGSDLVTAYESDYMLHDGVRRWLPYPASGTAGSFRSGAASASASYHGSASAYYGRTYEESPRDKVIGTTLPGYPSHPDEFSDDVVSDFPILLWRKGAVAETGVYSPGQLVAETAQDADGRITYSVKDHQGRLLATKREGAGAGWDASTRYVYDEMDRLAAVVGAGIPVSDTLSMWRYGYDSLGRLCSKGAPGSVREFYTYDGEDRVIAVTRGDETTETSYDAFGRVTARYVTAGGSRTQTEAHGYDGYSPAASALMGGSLYTSGPQKGLETWSSYAATDGRGGFSGTVTSAYAYDALGRRERTVTQYSDGHRNTAVVSYDFAGNRTGAVVTGVRPDGVMTDELSVTTTYDARERPACTVSVLRVGGEEKARDTTLYSYDGLGRRSAASSGPYSSAGLLETRYSYTLQQWTESVNTTLGGRPLFSETLGYDTTSASLGGPSYAGLITRKTETWSVPTGPTQSRTVSRTEDYAYDYAARLSAWDDSSKGEDISYDARGNMTSVEPRHGSGGAAAMTYSGDRLATRKVGSGATLSFAHDSFARMTEDGEAGLSVTYNVFDLPENISRGDTVKVRYAYLSDGTKVSALDASGAGLVYRGPFTYRRSPDGSSAFESAPFDGGWLTEAGVRICVTDHLGDVRAVIDGGSSVASYPPAGFFSMDDFAPFGTKSASAASEYLALKPTGATVSLRYGFTGKEDQEPDFGLPYTDFGARHYSPSLGRWLVPDPLGERHFDVSPYVYCFNNPTLFIDPDGRDGYEGSNGLYRWFDDRTGNNPFVDDDGTEWKWITDDRKAWNEAIVIREANIDALIMLNFNEKQVRTDVRLFPGTSALFTKESKLLNHEKYTEKWGRRFNSENFRRDAKESDDLGESGFRLKYYPEKGGDQNAEALGLVRKKLAHGVEAGKEKYESIFYWKSAADDPVYDMHYTNSSKFLDWINETKWIIKK